MTVVKAKKALGQNFLADQSVIERILETATVSQADWVLEIGPGTGVLTTALSERAAKVVAIEIDPELVRRLERQFTDSDQVSILEGNILDIHLEELIEETGLAGHQYKIIANLPYYITAPIIRTLLALRHPPQALTLMVQAEVADRLAATPGQMSLLSLMAQYYATVEKKFTVPKEAFTPIPKVESAVIHLVPTRTFSDKADRIFFRLARAGFAARRKTLANNLASSFRLDRALVEERLKSLGLRTDIRAQALAISDWERLAALWPESDPT